MNRLIILAFLALPLTIALQPAYAQKAKALERAESIAAQRERADIFYGALSSTASTGNVSETLKILSEGLSVLPAPQQLNPQDVAVRWLSDNTFDTQDATKQNFNAAYFMVLADLETQRAAVAQAVGKDADRRNSTSNALKSLMAYEVIGAADAERCGDPSVSKVIDASVVPRYRDLSQSYTILTKEQFDLLAYYATEVERLHPDRPLNTWLCSKGDMAKSTPGYKPTDIDPMAWLQKRNELRGRYKNLWSGMYYSFKDKK